MREHRCLVSLLSRLTRGSTDLVSEADSGSHFLYFSTGTKDTIKQTFSIAVTEYTTALLLKFKRITSSGLTSWHCQENLFLFEYLHLVDIF